MTDHAVRWDADVDHLTREEIPAVLGRMEEIRARLWLKMSAPANVALSESRSSALMTASEVASVLRFSRGHVYELIRAGELQAVRRGRAVRVTPEALERWKALHGAGIDEAYSVPLASQRDRQRGETHPRSSGTDAASARRAARGTPGDRREVGSGSKATR